MKLHRKMKEREVKKLTKQLMFLNEQIFSGLFGLPWQTEFCTLKAKVYKVQY